MQKGFFFYSHAYVHHSYENRTFLRYNYFELKVVREKIKQRIFAWRPKFSQPNNYDIFLVNKQISCDVYGNGC